MRPNKIEGIEPHNLEVPQKSSSRATSEDSLEQCKDYNENGLQAENENEVEAVEEANSEVHDLSKASEDEDEGDEGLGDIASEASNSPQPPLNSLSNNNKTIIGLEASNQNKNKNKNNNYSLPTSPCDERVPSRIPFQAKQKLHQSQTNL